MLLPYVWKLLKAYPERHSFLRYATTPRSMVLRLWSWLAFVVFKEPLFFILTTEQKTAVHIFCVLERSFSSLFHWPLCRLQMVMRRWQTRKHGLQSKSKKMKRFSKNIKLEVFFICWTVRKENRKEPKKGIWKVRRERAKSGNFNHISEEPKVRETWRHIYLGACKAARRLCSSVGRKLWSLAANEYIIILYYKTAF